MIAPAKKILSSPVSTFGAVFLISAIALASAFIAEVIFELEPCILCVYQRIPFVIGLALGLTGLILEYKPYNGKLLLPVLSLNFFINALIAFYHTGVERHWWRSAVEGCAAPNFDTSPQSILENIMSAPSARCDEIPWADPILGLSMANYNVVLCLGLSIACLASFVFLRSQTANKI